MMHRRFLDWFRSLVRHPLQASLGAAVLVLTAALVWLGVTTAWFHREWAEAEKAFAEYDYPEARARLATCVWLRPRDPAVRLLACRAARRDGDLDSAETHLDHCDYLTRRPSAEAKLERQLLRAQRGLVESVVGEMLTLVDAHHPRTEEILEAMAIGCVQAYHLERTIFWIQELLKRYPHSPTGRLIRAQTTETFGRKDLALEDLKALVQDFPKYVKARLHLAISLYRAGRDEEAVAHFEEVRRQRPGDLDATVGLARCLRRLERIEQARGAMTELLDRFPDNSAVNIDAGRFALEEGRWEDAERYFRRATELAPFDHDAHFGLATALQHFGREAEARLEEAEGKRLKADLARLDVVVGEIITKPQDPSPRLEAGQICLRNGQVSEGLRWLTGVLELSPDHPEAHQTLADYFQAQGDTGQATYHRNRAFGIGSFTPPRK